MPEVTDEMVQAFSRVFFTNPLGEDVRAGLAAVLEIVARDYEPRVCDHLMGLYRRCTLAASHDGDHYCRHSETTWPA